MKGEIQLQFSLRLLVLCGGEKASNDNDGQKTGGSKLLIF